MAKAEHKKFGEKLAFHSAPTLLGIKCANMIALSSDEFDIESHIEYFNAKACAKGLKSLKLCSCGRKALVLIYSERLMELRLADKEIRALLEEYGYSPEFNVEQCLERLSERIGESGDFPHEIGVFLGYPIEDVIGFIENKGSNYKCSGCWKVYGCEESAKRTFENYRKCRKFLCGKLDQGADIYQALKLA